MEIAVPDDWNASQAGLSRTFYFSRYEGLQSFVETVMRLASREDHHPTVTFGYTMVTVTFVTHDEGNTITELDTSCAVILNDIFEGVPQR